MPSKKVETKVETFQRKKCVIIRNFYLHLSHRLIRYRYNLKLISFDLGRRTPVTGGSSYSNGAFCSNLAEFITLCYYCPTKAK